MNTSTRRPTAAILVASALLLATLACLCGPLQQIQSIQTTIGAAQSTLAPALTELKQNGPTFEAQASEFALTLTAVSPELGQITTAVAGAGTPQWASSATASSQYGDTDWAASQATGAPNTTDCGDFGTAWASLGQDTQETLTLKYASAVIPTAIVIYHSYNPNSVVQVDVVDTSGAKTTVYQGSAQKMDQCPYQQTINVSLGTVTSPVDSVIISLDQSTILDWDEIDAVQLVGITQ
jgi:hypothetical protein